MIENISNIIMLLLDIVVIVGLIFLHELAIKVIVCIVVGIMGARLVLTVVNSILGTNNIVKK